MPSIGTLIWLALKYGPRAVKIIRLIAALIESIRGDEGGPAACAGFKRRLGHTVRFMEVVPPGRRPEARERLEKLRVDVVARAERSRR